MNQELKYLICNRVFGKSEQLRLHIQKLHTKAMFSGALKDRFVEGAIKRYIGGEAQSMSPIAIPEVLQVLGPDDPASYYGGARETTAEDNTAVEAALSYEQVVTRLAQ